VDNLPIPNGTVIDIIQNSTEQGKAAPNGYAEHEGIVSRCPG
jgi:hypothetical protein